MMPYAGEESEEDYQNRKRGEREREARARRRATLTEHARAVEDVVDEYTAAVRDDAAQAFFEKIAADRIERDRLASVDKARADRERKLLLAAREFKSDLEEFFHAVEVANATEKGD